MSDWTPPTTLPSENQSTPVQVYTAPDIMDTTTLNLLPGAIRAISRLSDKNEALEIKVQTLEAEKSTLRDQVGDLNHENAVIFCAMESLKEENEKLRPQLATAQQNVNICKEICGIDHCTGWCGGVCVNLPDNVAHPFTRKSHKKGWLSRKDRMKLLTIRVANLDNLDFANPTVAEDLDNLMEQFACLLPNPYCPTTATPQAGSGTSKTGRKLMPVVVPPGLLNGVKDQHVAAPVEARNDVWPAEQPISEGEWAAEPDCWTRTCTCPGPKPCGWCG